MAKRGRKKKEAQITVHSDETKIFFGLVLAVAGLIVLAAPFFYGSVFSVVTEFLGFSAVPWGVAIL
jgi:hypothetical protein